MSNPEKKESLLEKLEASREEVELVEISLDELKDINEDLLTKFVKPKSEQKPTIKGVLNLLTVLSRKIVNGKLIKESGVGKTLTLLSQKKDSDFENNMPENE